MYSKISYKANASNDAQKVLADLTLLLTGTTAVGSLTGDIDAGSSSINTSFQAVSYTLFDNISAAKKIFRVAVHDDAAQYFYVELWAFSTTEIHIRIWENWIAASNTGVGNAYYQSNNSHLISLNNFTNAPFTIYISATARHLIVRSVYNSGNIRYFRGFIQYDRGEVWDTPAAGKKPVVVTYGDTSASTALYALPHKRSDGAVYTLALANLFLATRYGNSQLDDHRLIIGGSSSAARGLNASGDSVHNMYEVGASYLSTGERFLSGKFADMYLATYQNGGFGDIVSIGGNNYIIWEMDLNYRMAIRQG